MVLFSSFSFHFVSVFLPSCCCCSVAKSGPTLCNPMGCSMPGFPVLHYLLDFAQIHVHWVGDAIQPPRPLTPPSPLPSILPSIRFFSSESSLHIRWPKYWSFSASISPSNEYSGLISFRIDWFDLLASPRDSEESSSTTIWKHQFFGASPTLTPINDYCKNHSIYLFSCLEHSIQARVGAALFESWGNTY